MPFPQRKREIYGKNPLVEVICQLRFPRILRLESELPVKFQESIGEIYPVLKRSQAIVVEVDGDGQQVSKIPKPVFEFVDKEGAWSITITSDYIALMTNEYVKWELFQIRFQYMLSKFLEGYSPKYFTRVGLRYKNLIQREALKLESNEWQELIKPHISGILASDIMADNIKGCEEKFLIELSNNLGFVQVRHGIVANQNNEDCYLIDSDFFNQNSVELGDVESYLQKFNGKAGDLFRWCIESDLHDAMDPKEPD